MGSFVFTIEKSDIFFLACDGISSLPPFSAVHLQLEIAANWDSKNLIGPVRKLLCNWFSSENYDQLTKTVLFVLAKVS